MALYTDGFAKDLQGLKNNLHYFQQLGINMIHNLNLNDPKIKSVFFNTHVIDLYSGDTPAMFKDQLVIPPYHFYWLTDKHRIS